jgi:hypothetical protein
MRTALSASLIPDEDQMSGASRTQLRSAMAVAASEALIQLDREGLFGAGPERDRVLLLSFVDHDRDAELRRAADLNPSSVAARYERETHTDGTFTGADTVAFGIDGTLFLAGSVKNPEGLPGSHDEFLGHVAAYELSRLELTQQWSFEFPGWGDSIRQIALPEGGQPLHALRLRYDNGSPSTMVQLLDVQDGRVLQQVEFPGEAASFAVRSDGERIAIATHGRRLLVVDGQLQRIRELEIAARPARMRYLRDGRLLVASALGLQQVEQDATDLTAPTGLPALRLSTDREERFLGVSQMPTAVSLFANRPRLPFGVTVFALPRLDEPRDFGLADHQAETVELSPDGRFVAFVARSIHTVRQALVVVDIATGAELVNQRCRAVSDLAFAPDGSALIVATSSTRTGPPVDLIPLPTA